MKVMLTGASGFIGRHLAVALRHAGHTVVGVVRRQPARPVSGVRYLEQDFQAARSPQDWAQAVAGMDVVVNTVGILRETATQRFDVLHRAAPCALFEAARQAGVRHIVQLSALGADEHARSGYHLSKRAADEFLMGLGCRASIVQPSLVYGPGGASAAMFGMFASLPIIPLPGQGRQPIQPVHLGDVLEGLVALVGSEDGPSGRIAFVGPEALSLRDYYARLRAGMAIRGAARFLPIPLPVMAAAAHLGRWLPGGLLDRETLDMLERGNTADPAAFAGLLGHAPRAPADFIPSDHARAAGSRAKLGWLLPLLRVSIAVVWIVTGVVSLGLYPVEESYRLLERTGVPSMLQPVFLYGAALLDLALGVLTLLPRRYRHRGVWVAQAGLVLAYTAIISVRLPEFWLHPYGPMLKNLPFLAALWLLYELEDSAWNT